MDDPRPLDEGCACATCGHYTRAYLHHLVRAGEILASMLLTAHNLHYYADVMRDLRGAIETGTVADVAARIGAEHAAGDILALAE